MPDESGAPIPMAWPASADHFDETAYLVENGDVRAAVQAGHFRSARAHFDAHGKAEGRRMRLPPLDLLESARQTKLERLEPLLRRDMLRTARGRKPDFLSDALRAQTRIIDTENVSSHSYDPAINTLIEACRPDGLLLDAGAGRRDVYHRNVVNFEIVDYDTTDVLGVGEELPFVDGAFDGVISVMVLEHVRDPMRCASEIARVLKPGGRLICAMPFLQPMHGYPHHYFNATEQGLRRLFEDDLEIEDVTVPPSLHPAWALRWIVESWAKALPATERAAFLGQPVADLLLPPDALVNASFSKALPAATQVELACGFLMTGRKATH